MKYYSETLDKLFDSSEECAEAEFQFELDKKAEARRKEEFHEARGKMEAEVKEAYAIYDEARNNYVKLVESYYKNFGPTLDNHRLSDLFKAFFL